MREVFRRYTMSPDITKLEPMRQDPDSPEPWYLFHVSGEFNGTQIDCDLSVNMDEGDISWAPGVGQSPPFRLMPGNPEWERFQDYFDNHPTAKAAHEEYHNL
jgi:hypothetical protein